MLRGGICKAKGAYGGDTTKTCETSNAHNKTNGETCKTSKTEKNNNIRISASLVYLGVPGFTRFSIGVRLGFAGFTRFAVSRHKPALGRAEGAMGFTRLAVLDPVKRNHRKTCRTNRTVRRTNTKTCRTSRTYNFKKLSES